MDNISIKSVNLWIILYSLLFFYIKKYIVYVCVKINIYIFFVLRGDLMDIKNKYTLITGGTEGIGLELAKLFAKDNHNLLIVARNKERLHNIKEQLKGDYGIAVKTIALDLSVDNSCEQLTGFVDNSDIIVDNLVNNVGIGSYGYFVEHKDGFEDKIINLNIVSLTKITKHYLKSMIENEEGGILNVASTAGFTSGPKMALYYSTKAYVLSLTEAIHEEVKPLGIRISCLCPGPVRTNFQKKAGIKKSKSAKKCLMDAEYVAKVAYKGFKKNKTTIIPGYKNKILVFFNKVIPRSLSRKIVMMTNK